MDRPGLYAWSEQQATALRGLAARRDLPKDLDLDNVVEEIESVGRSELRATRSVIRLILTHIAEAASEPEAPLIGQWRTECGGQQNDLQDAFSASIRQRINMDVLWNQALNRAELALCEHDRHLGRTLAGPCPVSLGDLLSDAFEFDAIIQRIAPT